MNTRDSDVDVVCFGENSVDFVAIGPLANPSSKERLSAFEVQVGGQAATAAVGAVRLGCRTRYVGVLGDDDRGRLIESTLRREGVEVAARVREKTGNRIALALVDGASGDRRILEHRDTRLSWRDGELPIASICRGRLLIADATDLPASILAARAAREAGMHVIVDVDRADTGVDSFLATATAIVVAEGVPEAFTGKRSAGEALHALHSQFNAQLTVVTLGDRGSLAISGGAEIATRAFRVTVRDTTGAGDAFRAGLAAAWLRLPSGVSAHTLMQYANATAALNCRAVGAQTGLPNWADVEALVTGSLVDQSK